MVTTLDRLRDALPPSARSMVRRVTDPMLRPIGSISGAHSDTSVALTFDDGPDPRSTPQVLEVLADRGVQATFFVLVERAEAHADVIEQIVAGGHEVGLHGLDHRRVTEIPAAELSGWLQQGRDRLAQMSRQDVRWFRPPFGTQTIRSYRAARHCGLDVVAWSADIEDWESHDATIFGRLVRERLQPGGVLLMHDAYAPPHDAPDRSDDRHTPPDIDRGATVDAILRELAELGLVPVTVGRLVGEYTERRTAWFRG